MIDINTKRFRNTKIYKIQKYIKIPKYQDTKIPKATKRYEKFMSNKYQKIYKSLGINTKINTKRYKIPKVIECQMIA